MSDNPRSNQPLFSKHVCIFELERKSGLFTAEVVCTVCGAYLSSQREWPPAKSKAAGDLPISESYKFYKFASSH
jgi:hypothetical protein